MTSSSFDVSSYDQIEVSFYFYANSMESGEDFWLRYFNGSTWETVDTWVRGTDFNNNTFNNASVILDKAQYTFALNSQFRFQNDASYNNDNIYIDQVTFTGINGGEAVRASSVTELYAFNNTDVFSDDELILYPNPIKGSTLNIKMLGQSEIEYRIVNILGEHVKIGRTTKEINVDNLKAGMYFIQVNDGEETIIKKFIKQ